MPERPSAAELIAVWPLGAAAVIAGYLLTQSDERSPTTSSDAGVVLFLVMPHFLVVYSLVWAWPLAARGDRATVVRLVTFAVVVQTTSGWFWLGLDALSITAVMMRLLALLGPIWFMSFAACGLWRHARRPRPALGARLRKEPRTLAGEATIRP